MNRIRIYIACLILILAEHVISQCDSNYVFYRQVDIDSFQSWYGPCNTILGVSIADSDTLDITNLEGLSEVKNINRLILTGKGAAKIESISALDSLEVVANMRYDLPKKYDEGFPSLKLISTLWHKFNGDSRDLSMYRTVERLSWLTTLGSGSLEELENFYHRGSFILIIQQNHRYSDISKLLKDHTDSLNTLAITRCSNLDFTGILDYREIDGLSIIECDSMDLSPLLQLKEIGTFSLHGNDENLNIEGGFQNITELDAMTITSTPNIESIDELFGASPMFRTV